MIELEQPSRGPVRTRILISASQIDAYQIDRLTWRIVSKLNVNPFHNVNSPLVDPVKIRLASGVNFSVGVCQLCDQVRPTYANSQ